jgi:3-phenylpropionate/trans-cinnamate dioxygenase ferredoxin subunit
MTAEPRRVRVAVAGDLCVGEKRRFEAGGRALVVGRIGENEYFALSGACPHQGADLAAGRLAGTCVPTDEVGRYEFDPDVVVLRCPWHGFEFDVRTGRHVFVPRSRFRLKSYPVAVEDGGVFVEL